MFGDFYHDSETNTKNYVFQVGFTLEAIKGLSLEDLFAWVLQERQTLTIRLSNDQAIIIAPQEKLKPLLVLDGYIPHGWKDAIYDVG